MDTTEMTEATQETVQEISAFMQQIQNSKESLIAFGFKIIVAIIFFLIGRFLIKWIRKIVKAALDRSSVDTGAAQFIDSFLKFGMYAILIFTIATKFGVDTASVAALIASAGVAVGLALQGSLSNFAGGMLILLLKPFVVGDYIIEDNHKNEGTVKEIQMFYTKLTTVDNKTIIIPNAMLTNNSLTNVTAKDERRIDLRISIAYDSDLRKAKQVIRCVLDEEPRINTEDEVLIFVDDLADSAVVIGVRAWVKTEDYWETRWQLLEDIKLALNDEDIEIPYPQLTVHTK